MLCCCFISPESKVVFFFLGDLGCYNEQELAIIDKDCKVHNIKSLKDSEFYSRKQQVNKISLIIFN